MQQLLLQRRRTSNSIRLLTLVALLLVQGSTQLAVAKGKEKSSALRARSAKKRLSAATTKRNHSSKIRSVNHKSAKKVAVTARTAANVTSIALMGPKYAHVTVKDQTLGGAVYYLASGHGGPDPGAIGQYGKYALAEDEYAYDVTIRLARNLMEHGATVYMMVRDLNDGIRDGSVLKLDHDEVAYPNQPIPLNQTLRLRQCTDAVNRLHSKHKERYQRFVTIHVDSRSEGQNIDVFFYHHENSNVGKQLAKHIHKSFKSGYKRSQPGRSYLGTVSDRSSLYVVRNSHPPTVFIELGNIRNDKDQRRFLLADNRQALANWICTGLQTDYTTR
ncbi:MULTISPECIES: N-acetylmuramoyl-L-alanine amidase [unclassified Spirosoma]|uniref:N-acetylmuramoyl-L-alanine amidase family protein n=1 Tax=unclassified Spirosoma TaxID=2621999 RepID=UPI000B30576B|nr:MULTISPECIES: N-acetylmuramoyl-L-alanine amidase [unclassified Spirosoma]